MASTIVYVGNKGELTSGILNYLNMTYPRVIHFDSINEAERFSKKNSQGGNHIYMIDQVGACDHEATFLEKINNQDGKIWLQYHNPMQHIDSFDFHIQKSSLNFFDDVSYAVEYLYKKQSDNYHVLIANQKDRILADEVQKRVFSIRHLHLPFEDGGEIIGSNPYDRFSKVFIATRSNRILGTTYLNKPNPAMAQERNTILGLPIEEYYDLSPIANLDSGIVQPRAATILPEHSNPMLALMLWGAVYRDVVINEPQAKYSVLLAATEISDEEKVRAIWNKALNDHVYTSPIKFNLKDGRGFTDFVGADHDGVQFPKILKMYLKMNYKIAGKPFYFENYKMFDFPMILRIDQMAELYKNRLLNAPE